VDLPIIVLGGKGHAKVVIDLLLLQGRQIIGYCDVDPDGQPVLGVPRLGNDEMILTFAPEKVRLANGIGSIRPSSLRVAVYERFAGKGYRFDQVIHPSAVVAFDVRLGDGVQIMARAVVQPGTLVGVNTIINTSASVDHDCVIGSHAHISPGAVLCGHVKVGDGTHVGAGATVIQGRSIGARSMVGAGSVVIENVAAEVTVAGVPSRVLAGKSSDCVGKIGS
jgi:sugar O-acyltransferase (sialic acid O-acetyltransferase NeuD family)